MSYTDRPEGAMTILLQTVAEKVIGSEEWGKLNGVPRWNFLTNLLPVVQATIDAVDEEPHRPKRGSDIEAWIKRVRDEGFYPETGEWGAVDALLDDYRLHADTGTPLSEEAHDGPTDPFGG